MTFHVLTVPAIDVEADELNLILGRPAPPALAELVLTHPNGGTVTLGVLGASHVVSVGSGVQHFTEQISCNTAPLRTPLPRSFEDRGYRLDAQTRQLSRAGIARVAGLLQARSEADARWITGRFPGDTSALTSLAASPERDGWSWRTWHLYPGVDRGTVVRTESRWRE
ncbi:DUF2617 family protein [Tomitella fengzijianii]|uniref:DUF2617 family protein n=1 Tax=Tomitella fengzijianii TaxID=2597660 RepID=A0A516X2Q5_9ACTN|nr:DUF2617 family protein [Tomitella fengzijianii]QDQ97333.1 DUF2617 family protein [Tomitella fengzijianii]